MEARSIVKKADAGRLCVVATPIGNLGDLSARARETLQACSVIAAEDTRHTGTLLKAFGITTPLVSLHEHNEAQRVPDLIQKMQGGASIALVSDAGTPAISDPGFDLVRAAAPDAELTPYYLLQTQLAAGNWDAVPDYLALLKSGVRQQYPARLAMLVYLQKSPNAKALGFSTAAAPADGKAGRSNPWLGQQ
jgi:hypothetical protein